MVWFGGCNRPFAGAHVRQLRGELNFIAMILERPAIEKILAHQGLQVHVPPRAPALGHALKAT